MTLYLIGGTLTASLLMVLTGGIILFAGGAFGLQLKTVAGILLCLSPVPIASTIVLSRLLDRYRNEAKSSTTRDPLTG